MKDDDFEEQAKQVADELEAAATDLEDTRRYNLQQDSQ